jgi:hypothetical protein
MNLMSRRELTVAVRDRYWRANKKIKKQILNEFVANTGYQRKYALALLNGRPRRRTSGRRRPAPYAAAREALIFLWNVSDRIATHRLHPFLPELLTVVERQGALQVDPATRRLLLQMSRSTMERLLQPVRRRLVPHGRSTTKPGTLLKKSIPIRTWAEWADAQPGFLEIDLVAHGGESTAGQYLATLNCVDVATGWCACRVPPNRGQEAVRAALAEIRARLPMPLLGNDSDNGPEFINDHLKRYCDQEKLTFTRSRPDKKNDQARVEGKNWTVVRRYVGYDRYEGTLAGLALNELYATVRLYVNFCQPVMKLVSKTRVDGKVKKVYDKAQTPDQRVLAAKEVSQERKDQLTAQYQTLHPVALHEQIQTQLQRIWRLAVLPQTAE